MARAHSQLNAAAWQHKADSTKESLGGLLRGCQAQCSRCQKLDTGGAIWKQVLLDLAEASNDPQAIAQARPQLETLAQKATEQHQQYHKAASREADASWNQHLDRLAAKQAEGLHRPTKPVPNQAPPIEGLEPHQQAQPIRVTAAKRAGWAKAWRVEGPLQKEPPRALESYQQRPLPPLNLDGFEVGHSKFKPTLGN